MTPTWLALLPLFPLCAAAQIYFPDAGNWQRKAPAEVGIDAGKLKEAVEFAVKSEVASPRDLTLNHYQTFGREPHGEAIGPIKDRGDPTGVIVRRGYLVAEWGEPRRVDMTHSVTKSLLSSVVGVAFDRGLIRKLDDPVRDYVPPVQPRDGRRFCISSTRRITGSSPGTTSCARRATGRGRSGASLTGPTGRARSRRSG
jgi:CubicO group peptidase (beta-lactamase class C family)